MGIHWRKRAEPPPDALAGRSDIDVISPEIAPTLPALFRERVRRSGDAVAYRQHDPRLDKWRDFTWNETAREVDRWIAALRSEKIPAGERVAVQLRNSWQWVVFDQAAMACGLVVAPIYVEDRPDNIAYVIEQTAARLLLLENGAQWRELVGEGADEEAGEGRELDSLRRVVVLEDAAGGDDPRVTGVEEWLAGGGAIEEYPPPDDGNALATIVFTSGTTGRPKGVMLSHRNMLADAWSGLHSVAVLPTDTLLSFLPFSHMFERTIGYYLPIMAGARVAFNRSIPELPEDLAAIQPTILVTVPRIFEKAYRKIAEQLEQGPPLKRWLFDAAVETGWRRFQRRQGRAAWRPRLLAWPLFKLLVAGKISRRFGGRLRFVVSGGAALSPVISKVFIGLGVPILQGYGLTETSPVLSVNTLENNRPATIGQPLQGVELVVDANGELLARGAPVMLGYWRNEQATREMIDANGWLHTGDCARIEDGFVTLTGRIKEIIVLANGEKVPPADMESAICHDPLFEQAMVMGEGRPYLTALVVLNAARWNRLAGHPGVEPDSEQALNQPLAEGMLLKCVAKALSEFPGYAQIYRLTAMLQPWAVNDGALTPTLKLKRPVLRERFQQEIERMYEGH